MSADHFVGATPRDVAARLRRTVLTQLEALSSTALARWQPPPVFGGHRVGADVTADLIFTLGHLRAGGVERVGDEPISSVITSLLGGIDGPGTNTFFSYRVAETLAAEGQFEGNPLLEPLDGSQRAAVAEACDSTDWIDLLDSGLPRNYAAVLARCEATRLRLGLPADPKVLEGLIDRVTAMLSADPHGYLDDAEDGTSGRIDIYTLDVYLFCEPLADRLGSVWGHGAEHAIALAERTAHTNGAALAWGRSTGALAVCHLVELGALALTHGFGDDPGRWLARTANAAEQAEGWFADGVINAHQHRSPYGYRGPSRRLQMTLDCLGKLAWAAARLEAIADDHDRLAATTLEAAYPPRDEWLALCAGGRAGVWSHRSHGLALTLALVGPALSDYLPVPSNPSLFEVPVDRALTCWLPAVWGDGRAWCGGGVPAEVTHHAGELRARWDRFVPMPSAGSEPEAFAGTRDATYRVEGRTLVIDERLEFEEVPEAVAVAVPEAAGRPLRVEVETGAAHKVARVDTTGLKEWRSFWGELPVLHEVSFEPARQLSWSLRATPLLRVASEAWYHHYHQSLYAPLAGHVIQHRFARHHLDAADGGASRLTDIDQFHLHWPEWFVNDDLGAMRRFLDLLARQRIRLVWTQHNLVPHWEDPAFEELYAMVAGSADAVVHHSRWGMDRARERYEYRADSIHRVIPHGHFGNLLDGWSDATRAAARREAEAELDLQPCKIRIGIIGAPRREKQTVEFMEAFARCERDDLGLLVLSLTDDEVASVPDDPRIRALPYEYVDRATYNRRVAALDAIALPFAPEGTMLTTGVVADVVGLGIPALSSDWPFALEALGDAAIRWGNTSDQLVDVLDTLDPAQLERAAAASRALQTTTSWEQVATQTLALLEDVGTAQL